MSKNIALERKTKQKVIPLKIDATFFFERAVRSLDRCHYDKALKYFRRAVEYEPDNAVNHCNLAGVLAEIGNFEESNAILLGILEKLDPGMAECHYYLANNYANMDDFEAAEQAVLRYLETDEDGIYVEEAEEMVELLSYELGRPVQIRSVRSRGGVYEHDEARRLLEEGRFVEATGVLQKLVKKYPEFLAARNNLALGFYYLGDFEQALQTVFDVLKIDEGNLHALCNLAIFYQHLGETEKLAELSEQLRKTYPFHPEYLFKLATTMGILGDHETAYRLFHRLLKIGAEEQDPSLYHYTAVAAYNTGRFEEARKRWKQVGKLDPGAEIARFYLEQLERGEHEGVFLHYHYHLPFEQKVLATAQEGEASLSDSIKRDPLVRSSFFWGLRHGDAQTKLQVIQAFGAIADEEAQSALRSFLLEPEESDSLKRIALFALRSMGDSEPLPILLSGTKRTIGTAPYTPSLPVWEEDWQAVLTLAHQQMAKRYDLVQQCDLESLWVEYLTCVYPVKPRIAKIEGWSAALEYLTAKMHRRAISFEEVAGRYGISAATVSRTARRIDEACRLMEKVAPMGNRSSDEAGDGSDNPTP
ncbi:tetratricopeptide repeat protein [Gorillibacterium sp. CAU 1737]|uniref:tetratricopeptide repeat protein n=1 Tax=Gorillibacterium sp. CAU 1737 TaxID=3140362 RepID=UPI003260BFAA